MANKYDYGTGRRKTATARVFLSAGTGKITINNKSLEQYFGRETARMMVMQPLELLDVTTKFDLYITVKGVIFKRFHTYGGTELFLLVQIPYSGFLSFLHFHQNNVMEWNNLPLLPDINNV